VGTGDGVGLEVGFGDGNTKHVVAPGFEFWPAGHVTHDVEPLDIWYLPAEQAMHASAEVAPVVEQYVPALHGVQSTDPVTAAYLPPVQLVQDAPEKSLES